MASIRERVSLPGMLRGDGGQATCTVHATKVSLPGAPGTFAYAECSVDNVSEALPDGIYDLSMPGQNVSLRKENGAWLSATGSLRFRDREPSHAALALVGWYSAVANTRPNRRLRFERPFCLFGIEWKTSIQPAPPAKATRARSLNCTPKEKRRRMQTRVEAKRLDNAFRLTIRASKQNETLNKSVTPLRSSLSVRIKHRR